MSARLKYSLLSDGTSDDVLVNIIDWTIRAVGFQGVLQSQFVEFQFVKDRPRDLRERICKGLELFPCDLLFIHRDAEGQNPSRRLEEIRDALPGDIGYVPIIPVRMTEAWLLFDGNAICTAADNPEYASKIKIPPLRKLESLADPKKVLFDFMIEASMCSGRRLDDFKRGYSQRYRRVAQLIDDYSPLRKLSAFRKFEQDCRNTLSRFRLLT